MKKNVLFLMMFLVSIAFPQNKVYRYDINVKNKVVYARVFYKGKLVDNLTKKDFILYENGKPMNIIGVDIIHKKFAEKEIVLETGIKEKYKPRFFVLTFQIIDFNDSLKKGIEYLFNKILKPDDKLMFMSEHNFFIEDNLTDKELTKKRIIKILKRESKLSRMNLNRVLSRLKSLTYSVREYLNSQNKSMQSSTQQIREFEKLELTIQRFLILLREYKERYLTPDIDRFYYFSQYLKGVKMKKWVINFYQLEKVPVPTVIKDFMEKFTGGNVGSQGLMASKEIKAMEMRIELERELNLPGNFPSDEIAKLFYKVDTTFYTILLNNQRETLEKDYYYKNIYTNLEKTLKDISFSTGGDVVRTNSIEESVKKFQEKEDIIYMLNYVPQRKNPKIKVKMKNTKYKVKYDPNQFSDYIRKYIDRKRKENPKIIIDNYIFKDNSLVFTVKDYKKEKINGEEIAKIAIALKLTDDKGEIVFNQRKILKATDNFVKTKIKLKGIDGGIYYLYLDVYDLISKRMFTKFDVVEIKGEK